MKKLCYDKRQRNHYCLNQIFFKFLIAIQKHFYHICDNKIWNYFEDNISYRKHYTPYIGTSFLSCPLQYPTGSRLLLFFHANTLLTMILLRQSKLVLANLSIINKMAHRHKPPYFIIPKSLFIFSWKFDIPQSLPATSLKFP